MNDLNECSHEEAPKPPEYPLTPHDLIGLAISCGGYLFNSIGGGLLALGQEFYAAGRHWRTQKVVAEYRERQAAEQEHYDAQFSGIVPRILTDEEEA